MLGWPQCHLKLIARLSKLFDPTHNLNFTLKLLGRMQDIGKILNVFNRTLNNAAVTLLSQEKLDADPYLICDQGWKLITITNYWVIYKPNQSIQCFNYFIVLIFLQSSKGGLVWIGLAHKNPICSTNCSLQSLRQGWTWTDNSLVTYQNWEPNSPRGHKGERCGLLAGLDGYWNDLNCSSRYTYICELEINRTAGNTFDHKIPYND